MSISRTTPPLHFWLMLFTMFLVGCGPSDTEKQLWGTWKFSLTLSEDQVRRFSEEPLPPGVEMEIKLEGTQTFQRDGKYTLEADVTFVVKTMGEGIPLRFHLKDEGDYTLRANDTELVSTTAGGTFTGRDEISKLALLETPDLAATMMPKKGEVSASKILSISATRMEFEEQESPNLKIQFTKQP